MTTPVNDTIVMPISDKTEPIASNNNSFVKAEETSSKTSAEDDGMSNAIITICVSIVLVLFFQSITPAESYLHEYLQIDKRIDRNQMHQNIWPMYTYSHFAALIPLTIAAERYCHYPPIIILAILMRLASSLIHEMSPPGLVWPHQLSLALFGIACAGKAAFRAFVYSVLPSRVYFSMTSYTRGANSAAHVLGGLIGWILKRLQMPWSMFYRIQQICLGTALVSFLVGLQISSRSRSKPSSSLSSIHFHDLIRSWGDVRDQIREAYTCGRLLIYSIWIIVAGAIFEFVMINATTLLHKIDDSATENGLIFGVGKCLAAGLTICLSRYSQFMERNGFRILQMQSWVVVLALALAYGATRISIAYVSLILTCISYDICFCISMTLIASSVPTSIRGVVIFCNTVISLAVQTALQALLSYMRLDIFQYYLAATIVFIVISVFLHLGEYGMRRVARLVPSSSSNGVMA